ncbi:hypothetical protein SELMODRAFT_405191 [Selaginella moellendorffii]|uniref:Uncharacterized protein n=1 Tax=Selaginella moellendorffii TaxID=88036 RepID=D8QWI9_SELML|nr:hypothetical protein SELMODRAFT_405191 [Selaginella moellendorffii]
MDKIVVSITPRFTNLIFSSVFVQVGTLFLNQGDIMERHLGRFQIPAASFTLFITLTICIIMPLYDRCFVPFARRITGNEREITMLQRIGIGQNEFFYDQAPDSMRSIGVALYLGTISIGSFISSLWWSSLQVQKVAGLTAAGPNNLNRAHIDYFYWLLTILSTLGYMSCVRGGILTSMWEILQFDHQAILVTCSAAVCETRAYQERPREGLSGWGQAIAIAMM